MPAALLAGGDQHRNQPISNATHQAMQTHQTPLVPVPLTATPQTTSHARWGLCGSAGQVQIDVPRDRASAFELRIVKKRRLAGVDEIVLSLYANGLTTGLISAHFAEI